MNATLPDVLLCILVIAGAWGGNAWWYYAAVRAERKVALLDEMVRRDLRVLHEAIALWNYGAHREALELLAEHEFEISEED